MEYTSSYFINKFSKIPNRMWIVGSDGWQGIEGRFCADGFCGSNGGNQTEESKALARLLHPLIPDGSIADVIWKINDGTSQKLYTEDFYPTPKDRILAALYDVANINKEFVERVEKLIKDRRCQINMAR